uniref:Filamentous hemagglutinin N-terminal domain-containing protein n=1 Tax=Lyngbya confervoides BDU141951 TaxID=1574623 RepID=A0A8T6QXT3_9CYAN
MIHGVAIAQPIPDNSLGDESSLVTGDVMNGLPAFLIEGGAQRSQNLFHSFLEFGIENGQQVYFADPLGVENIFSRVTGDQASIIDGLLGIAGTADLYFLNPNGVMFGPDASLDIAGSLFVSTADNFTFADGTTYAANPEAGDSILTVSIPLGLQTGVPPQGEIRNAANLQLPAGESLTLLGNQVEQTGAIAVPAGTVRLLGDRVRLTDTADLDVSGERGGGLMQIGGDFQGQGTVPTASQTQVAAGGTLRADAIAQGDGGTIIVWADDTTEFAGFASARGGELAGDGGLIEVSGAATLSYTGQADASAPVGTVGTLLLDPTDIVVNIPEAIAISGSLANVLLQADRDITFNANIALTAPGVGLTAEAGRDININRAIEARGTGDLRFVAGRNINYSNVTAFTWSYGGDIDLIADGTISLLDASQADTAPFTGDSGDLTVTATNLILTDGAQLKTGPFFDGAGGDIAVNVSDTVSISGVGTDNSFNFGQSGFISRSLVNFSTGTSGDIEVNAPNLLLFDGGAISAENINGQPGGDITVNAPNQIQLLGESAAAPGFRSSISASTNAGGNGGNVTLATNRLSMTDGAFVGASALGLFGNGGTIDVTAHDISISGTSQAGETSGFLNRTLGFGNAGDLTIRQAKDVSIRDGGSIDLSAQLFGRSGTLNLETEDLTLDRGSVLVNSIFGDAGQVNVNASGTFLVTNDSVFSGDIFAAGNGSVFDIRANDLVVNNRSFISTATFGAGGGSNLSIRANTVEVANNGFISTGTLVGTGDGGNLSVRADRVLVDRGLIEANSFGDGNAGAVFVEANDLTIRNQGEVAARGFLETSGTGDITINARTVQLEDEGKIIVSAPSTNGGNIFLTARDRLILRRQSLISANAGDPLGLIVPPPGTGNGGNITINTPFIIAIPGENSDITASASLGNGGNVSITARALFGIEFRDRLTPLSDITATSDFGLNGTVNIATADTTAIENNLSELPDLPLSTDLLVAGSCLVADGTADGSFIVTGADGLPTNPSTGAIATFPTNTVRNIEEPEPAAWQPGDPIQEPSGVYQLSNGRLVLSHECGER